MADTAIGVQGLVKRFGSVTALGGIDFAVPRGTVFGLLGRNGAGKTTIVRILATILRPDAGRAEVMTHDVGREPDAVRHLIGLAGQSAAVDPNLTGKENLRLVGRLAQLTGRQAKARSDELLERFHLADVCDRPARTYSGGMRRRLDVAAALVHRPPVVFLDEPTTGLDIYSREDLWTMIRELVTEGATVLLTTQYLEEADRLADRVAVVAEGRIIADDSPAALKAKLGSTVIEIGLGGEPDVSRALDVLSGVIDVDIELAGTILRFTSEDSSRVLIAALRCLDEHDITPARLAVREPSLDDVFLTLTGRNAA